MEQSSFMKTLLQLLGFSLVSRRIYGGIVEEMAGEREERSEQRCKDWRIVTGSSNEAEQQLMNHKSYACIMQAGIRDTS